MRKYLLLTTGLVALVGLTLSATATFGTTVQVGDLIVSAEGTFWPQALSRTAPAPVSLNISGEVRSASGAQPPALREIVIESDRNIAFSTRGLPVCGRGMRDIRDPAVVEQACRDAIIGRGRATISVKFPEQAPIPAQSPLLVFNGGERGRVTTLFVHAYLTQPITTAVVITVKVRRVKNGRYGIKSVASVPVIAGGAGSITDFDLLVNKRYAYKGKRVSVLTAKCPDGKLQNTAEAVFQDGTKAKTDVVSACTPKS